MIICPKCKKKAWSSFDFRRGSNDKEYYCFDCLREFYLQLKPKLILNIQDANVFGVEDFKMTIVPGTLSSALTVQAVLKDALAKVEASIATFRANIFPLELAGKLAEEYGAIEKLR